MTLVTIEKTPFKSESVPHGQHFTLHHSPLHCPLAGGSSITTRVGAVLHLLHYVTIILDNCSCLVLVS